VQDAWYRLRRALTSPAFLRCASGYVYFHFGFLKFFPDLSPAEMLAEQTMIKMSFGLVSADRALQLLAVSECLIGLALLFKVKLRWLFPIVNAHMLATFAPLVLLPELTFKVFPFAPTMEGLFILKNVAMIAGMWVVLYPAAYGVPRAPAWRPAASSRVGRTRVRSSPRLSAADAKPSLAFAIAETKPSQ
jgi:hypothetical protein